MFYETVNSSYLACGRTFSKKSEKTKLGFFLFLFLTVSLNFEKSFKDVKTTRFFKSLILAFIPQTPTLKRAIFIVVLRSDGYYAVK